MAKRTTRKKATRKKATRKAPARKKATSRGKSRRKASAADFIISKSRTKAASNLNVSGDFYGALDSSVRELIASATQRAEQNGRRTLRPHDL